MSLLVRPEPFSQDFARLVNTLFEAGDAPSQPWVPAMDLVEADDHYVLKADLPGLGEDDVNIEIQDGTLTVSGERRTEHETSRKGWYRVERSFGRFRRSLSLPEGVDADAVSADFDNGVLTVWIPKPAERQPRRVQIGGGSNGQPVVEGTITETDQQDS